MSVPEITYPITDVHALFKRDFYWSFLYSQGSPGLQGYFYEVAAALYQKNLSPDDQRTMLSAETEVDFSKFKRRSLPGGHIPTSLQSDEDKNVTMGHSFGVEAGNFHGCIAQRFRVGTMNSGQLQALGINITSAMIDRDLIYQTQNRGVGSDAHASYFRNHVLLGSSARTPTFDATFAIARNSWQAAQTSKWITGSRVDISQIHENFEALEATWRVNHPGESFEHAS